MSLYTIGCTVAAASMLQIPQLLQMCTDFMLAELNTQTCVYVWNMAAAYALDEVRDAARRFVLENFTQFAETPQFTQLTLEQITAFLEDDALVLPSELTAFQVRKNCRKIGRQTQTYSKQTNIQADKTINPCDTCDTVSKMI